MNNENLQPVEKLTPFTKMVMSIGTLPSSFYASMSYYESMVWLYEYLKNEVIPTVNGNAEAVEELQEAFTTLDNYIKNYFNNLDVQEEINNKLDLMAMDGTLTTLIKMYIDPLYQAYETEINGIISNQNTNISNQFQSQNQNINNFKNEVNEDIQEINNKVEIATSGSPKGVYATVSDLTTNNPDHNYTYVVTADGKWYYYNTSTSTWTAGGTYQATAVSESDPVIEQLRTDIDTYAFRISDNLYNPATDTDNYVILADGTLSENNQFKTTDFIDISKNRTVSYKCATSYLGTDGPTFVAQYDASKNFVSNSRSQTTNDNGYATTTFLEGRKYIRFSINKNANPFMVNFGDTLENYEPYGAIYSDILDNHIEDIAENIIPTEENIVNVVTHNDTIEEFIDDKIEENIDSMNGNENFKWSSMEVPNYGQVIDYNGLDGSGEFTVNTTLTELYEAWDELMENNPNYISKTDLGMDASNTYHLYKYSFVPETINVLNNYIPFVHPPKILLGGGVHGNGLDAGDQPEMIFATYYLFKNICENWKDNEALAYLRWHVRFEIIPVQNPWGYVNKSRRNSNLVDLNRNFSYGWTLGTFGANDYGGPSAFSEAESVIIKDFVEDNQDAIFHIDIHTTGGIADQDKMMYFSMINNNDMYYVANDLTIQLSEKWNSENIGGLNTTINFHGYISDSHPSGNGQINQWVLRENNIPSCVIEGFPSFSGNTTGVHSKTVMKLCTDELINLILRGLKFEKHKKEVIK